jgi:hypothetical protein
MAIEHFSQVGDAITPGQEPRLGEGVRGSAFDLGEQGVYLPLIIAEREGNGDVGRWLDDLPRDRRVVVPNAMNARLVGMLLRRGFTPAKEYDPEFDAMVDIYHRSPEAGPPRYFDRQGRPLANVHAWAALYEDSAYRLILNTRIKPGHMVSTVWEGIAAWDNRVCRTDYFVGWEETDGGTCGKCESSIRSRNEREAIEAHFALVEELRARP